MNGGLGWIRGLKGKELARLGMGTIFLVYVTGSEKRAHFAHKMIFQYKRFLKQKILMSIIFVPNRYLQIFTYTHAKFERLEALLKGRARCLKADT